MKKNFIISIILALVFAPAVFAQDMDFSNEKPDIMPLPQDQGVGSYFLNRSLFSINYNFSFPFGDLNDFIETNSYTGFDVDLKGMVTDNLAVGGMIGFQSYYKKYPRDTYYFENGALTSTIFKYYYTVPIRAAVDYFFNPTGYIQPFIGLGVGVNYNERRLEVGFYSLEDKSWNFVLAPEAGVIIPFSKYSEWGFTVKARYNYQVYNRDNFSGLHFLDLGIGFAYSY